MNICEALFNHLKKHPEVSSIVESRIYPLLMPQKAKLPAIVYTKISAERKAALQEDTPFSKHNIQLTCYTKSYAQGVHLLNTVRKSLKDYNGTMGDDGGVHIQSVLHQFETEQYDSQTDTYMFILELQFQFNE